MDVACEQLEPQKVMHLPAKPSPVPVQHTMALKAKAQYPDIRILPGRMLPTWLHNSRRLDPVNDKAQVLH